MKFAVTIFSIFALAVGAAQAATKSDKDKTNNTGERAAKKNLAPKPNSGRGSASTPKPEIFRYDPVGKD